VGEENIEVENAIAHLKRPNPMLDENPIPLLGFLFFFLSKSED